MLGRSSACLHERSVHKADNARRRSRSRFHTLTKPSSVCSPPPYPSIGTSRPRFQHFHPLHVKFAPSAPHHPVWRSPTALTDSGRPSKRGAPGLPEPGFIRRPEGVSFEQSSLPRSFLNHHLTSPFDTTAIHIRRDGCALSSKDRSRTLSHLDL